MNAVLWVVGEPGVGKTSALRHMLPPGSKLIRSPKWTVTPEVAAAGHYTGGKFDGADTVPYNGVKPCLEYWRERLSRTPLTIFDGDRFSYGGAVEFFDGLPHKRLCVLLRSSAAAERRAGRGGGQDEVWLKGRITKAGNFHGIFPEADKTALTTDGMTPHDVAQFLRSFVRGKVS